MEMPIVGKSATDGGTLGGASNFLWKSIKRARNPMVMRKIEIQNAIAWEVVSPQEGGR